jgi:type I restriction enzyme S subunit
MFGNPISNEKGFQEKDFINVVKLQRGYDLPNQDRDKKGSIPVYGANGILDKHTISKSKNGIITGRSGTIGKVYYSFEEFWPLNTTLFSIETYGNNIVYLKYLLDMFNLKRFVDATGVPTLNRNIVHKQKIIDAPIELQNRFADIVKQIDKQKFEIENSLKEMQELYESLMEKYFG